MAILKNIYQLRQDAQENIRKRNPSHDTGKKERKLNKDLRERES